MEGLEVSAERKREIVEGRLRNEMNRGVQTIQYQVVTLMTTNGQAPFITVFMYLGEARNPREGRPGYYYRGDHPSALPGRQERGRGLDHAEVSPS